MARAWMLSISADSASIPELGRGLIGRPAASKALDHKQLRSLAALGMRLVAALARFESPFERVGVPCGPRFDERMFAGCRDEATFTTSSNQAGYSPTGSSTMP
jgi:hypothetical protein